MHAGSVTVSVATEVEPAQWTSGRAQMKYLELLYPKHFLGRVAFRIKCYKKM